MKELETDERGEAEELLGSDYNPEDPGMRCCACGFVKTFSFQMTPPFCSCSVSRLLKEDDARQSYLSSCELVASMLRMLLSASGQPDRL